MITRQQWYNFKPITLEIVKSLIHRETVFLPFYQDDSDGKIKAKRPIRNLNASYDGMLKRHWEQYDFFGQKMNLYASLVTWRDFPTFSYKWNIRSQEQDIWNDKFDDYIDKFDLFIETDSPDLLPAIQDAKVLKKMFDGYKLRYNVKSSGSKGIHIIVPYDEFAFLGLKCFDRKLEQDIGSFNKYIRTFPKPLKELGKTTDLVLLFKTINVRLNLIYALSTIDTSVSDVRRISKTSYSWDVKSDRICLPLDDTQLENFDKKIISPDYVYANIKIFKRGQLWRNEDIDVKTRQKGILSLLSDLEIIV